DADVVTRSTATGPPPSAPRNRSTSAEMRSIRSLLVGPRLEPADPLASYPFLPAADGRLQKYFGALNACPIRLEPTVSPSTTISDPLACWRKATWPMAQTATG